MPLPPPPMFQRWLHTRVRRPPVAAAAGLLPAGCARSPPQAPLCDAATTSPPYPPPLFRCRLHARARRPPVVTAAGLLPAGYAGSPPQAPTHGAATTSPPPYTVKRHRSPLAKFFLLMPPFARKEHAESTLLRPLAAGLS
jgi:hypothetical protein